MLSGVYGRLVTSFGEKGAYCVVLFFFLRRLGCASLNKWHLTFDLNMLKELDRFLCIEWVRQGWQPMQRPCRVSVFGMLEEQQRDHQSLWNRLGGWSGQWRSQKAEGVGSCRLPSLHKDLQTEEKEPWQSFKERSSLIWLLFLKDHWLLCWEVTETRHGERQGDKAPLQTFKQRIKMVNRPGQPLSSTWEVLGSWMCF